MSDTYEDIYSRFEANALGSREMYSANYGLALPMDSLSQTTKVSYKVNTEYAEVKDLESAPAKKAVPAFAEPKPKTMADVEDGGDNEEESSKKQSSLVEVSSLDQFITPTVSSSLSSSSTALTIPVHNAPTTDSIIKNRKARSKQPDWHAPWKLKRVIAGHQGWVRGVAVDPSNEWFATASVDRTIKIWDLASGVLKLTLTGHVATVRAVDISARHPYLFSASDDKDVRLWDMESNRCIRTYHGHLGAVSAVKVHPTLDVVVTGSKDRTVKIWDIRSRVCVRTLIGHQHMISALDTQATDPQVISGSQDGTIRLWDIIQGKAVNTLTHHKKSVRALKINPSENSFVSASSDSVRMWKLEEGVHMHQVKDKQHEIVNAVDVNRHGVCVTGSDTGALNFYDYRTGYNFQSLTLPPQPGSLESEKGIFACQFDMTGTRLITCDADKSIKIYAEDDTATPETYPLRY